MIESSIRDWMEECQSRVNEDGEIDEYSCVGCAYIDLCSHLEGGYPICEFKAGR